MKYILLITSLLWTTMASAQTVDQRKMDKDIEIASNVLQSLLNKNNRGFRFPGESGSINGRYKDDYGVIFTFETNGSVAFGYINDGQNANIETRPVIIEQQAHGVATTLVRDSDKERMSTEDLYETAIRTFFKDYASIIRQLKPTDKIKILNEPRRENVFWYGSRPRRNYKQVIGEVTVSDVRAYSDGSMTEDALDDKIRIKVKEAKEEKIKDLEVFASALSRVMSSDMSNSYYMTSIPFYNYIEDEGATIYCKVYSSVENENSFFLATVDKTVETNDERDRVVESLYPMFLDEIKEHVLDYGNLVKTVKSNENFIVDVALTKCEECTIPENVELTIAKTIINNYRDGKIDASEAKNKFKIREY